MPCRSTWRRYGRHEILGREDEAELALRIREGDEEALNRLVAANLRFVVSVARRYAGHGVPLADLVTEGNIGLMRAARRFDETKGVRFISVCRLVGPAVDPASAHGRLQDRANTVRPAGGVAPGHSCRPASRAGAGTGTDARRGGGRTRDQSGRRFAGTGHAARLGVPRRATPE